MSYGQKFEQDFQSFTKSQKGSRTVEHVLFMNDSGAKVPRHREASYEIVGQISSHKTHRSLMVLGINANKSNNNIVNCLCLKNE